MYLESGCLSLILLQHGSSTYFCNAYIKIPKPHAVTAIYTNIGLYVSRVN